MNMKLVTTTKTLHLENVLELNLMKILKKFVAMKLLIVGTKIKMKVIFVERNVLFQW